MRNLMMPATHLKKKAVTGTCSTTCCVTSSLTTLMCLGTEAPSFESKYLSLLVSCLIEDYSCSTVWDFF